MAAKPKKGPYDDQAQAASLVRYGPELSALTALLRQATETYDDRVRAAKTGRQFAVGAVDQAVPQVTKAYQGAEAAVQPAFAQGGGVEASALHARLGESGALAQSQLAARRVSAIEGEGANRVQALRDLRSDKGKIADRALDLTREQGAFSAQTIAELTGADTKAAADVASQNATLTQSERNSIRSSGMDPDSPLPGGGYAPIPGGKLDPKANGKGNAGRGWASATDQGKAADAIQAARAAAREQKDIGFDRADTAHLLLTGADDIEQPIYSEQNGKQVRVLWKKGDKDADGKPIDPGLIGTQKTRKIPGVAKVDSQLLLSAALDMEYDGHLSKRNQQLLHDRGIQLKPLGLVTYGEWLKQRLKQGVSRGGSTGGTSQDPYGSGPGHH